MARPETFTYLEKGKVAGKMQVVITEEFQSPVNASSFMHGELNGRAVTLKFSTTGFADNEYAGLSLLYQNGVYVPQPIRFIQRTERPTSGILMERVYGNTLDQVTSARNRILLGNEIGKVNEIAVSGFGYVTNGHWQFRDGKEHVESEIATIIPFIQGNGNAIQLMLELWDTVKVGVIAQQPRFIHRDVKDKNVIVDPSGKITLIDLEYWNGGDPMWDVGGYLFYILRTNRPNSDFDEFLQGYVGKKQLTDAQRLKILFYSLISAGRLVELVSRIDPNNLGYAIASINKVAGFVRGKLQQTT